MPIVFCSFEIHLAYSRSLKDKRNVLRKTCDRLRARFNFSISEIDYQNVWQRARLGAVSIGSSRGQLQQVTQKLVREAEGVLGSDLINYDVEFFDYE